MGHCMRHPGPSLLAVSALYGTIRVSLARFNSRMLNEIRQKLHKELGIPEDYVSSRKLPTYVEADDLVDVGPNLVGRMQRLTPAAAAK